jgi:hypothetical protein
VVTLTPGERDPPYPLVRRRDGPQSQSGQHGEEKILDPTKTQTLITQSSSPEQKGISFRFKLKFLFILRADKTEKETTKQQQKSHPEVQKATKHIPHVI